MLTREDAERAHALAEAVHMRSLHRPLRGSTFANLDLVTPDIEQGSVDKDDADNDESREGGENKDAGEAAGADGGGEAGDNLSNTQQGATTEAEPPSTGRTGFGAVSREVPAALQPPPRPRKSINRRASFADLEYPAAGVGDGAWGDGSSVRGSQGSQAAGSSAGYDSKRRASSTSATPEPPPELTQLPEGILLQSVPMLEVRDSNSSEQNEELRPKSDRPSEPGTARAYKAVQSILAANKSNGDGDGRDGGGGGGSSGSGANAHLPPGEPTSPSDHESRRRRSIKVSACLCVCVCKCVF